MQHIDEEKNWKPNENFVEQLEDEIEQSFRTGKKSLFDRHEVEVSPELPDKHFIKECAKIGAFLMDEQAVLKQLERLNTILAAKINAMDNDADKVYLLRKTIEEELGKLGFHPELGKAITNVEPINFRMAIAHGLLLKDPSVGDKNHGEFTHALQWLAIAWQQQDTNFLGRPAVKIFKELGEEKSVYFRATATSPDEYRAENSIWDIVVDDLYPDFSGFRSPEKLNQHLLGEKIKDLSTLQDYLENRVDERSKSRIYSKYSSTELASASVFKRKTGRQPYNHSEVKNVMTPKNITIGVENFKERSSRNKGKK